MSTWYFMGRLFAYHPLPQVASGLCWVLFHSWPLFPGLIAKAFFDALDRGGTSGAGLNVETLAALVLVLAVLRAGFVYGDAQVGTTVGFRIRALLRRNLLARVFERPGARALPVPVGEALSTFRDDVDTMWGAGWAFDVIGFLVFALGGLAILLSVDARVTLLAFGPVVAVLALSYVVRTRLRRLRERSREATARVTGSMGEVLGAVQAIQVAGAETRVVEHLRRLGEARQRAALGDRTLGIALDAVFSNSANLGAGLTLLVVAGEMRRGSFTVGEFALFATYLLQVAEMTGFLGWIVATYQQMGVAFARGLGLMGGEPAGAPAGQTGSGSNTTPARALAQRLVEHHPIPLHDQPEELVVAQPPVDRLERLSVVGLTYRQPESGRGIEDVSFTVEAGALTVITGRVGAGKTTLLRVLLGLLPKDAGQIVWNGRPVDDPATFLVPPRAAYTAQTPTLLSGTLRENIVLDLAAGAAEVEQAVRLAALGRDVAGFPDGLETVIGTRGARLSGGQAQRTAAARMLVRQPELLVVDDLSSALDVETEWVLWDRLLDAGGSAKRRTILAVSHRPALLRRADQVLVLADGRLRR